MNTILRNTAAKSSRQGALCCLAAAGLASAALLTGCGVKGTGVAPPSTVIPGVALHGVVHGGQQPVTGATVKLYAAGTTGYGVAPTYTTGTGNLLTAAVTSDSYGGFNITGLYTCPSSSTLLYLVATGGNSGYTNNANLSMMTALGPCGNLTSSTSVTINEVTTVASVYSLARFMASITAVGTSSTNVTGLTNAFADVNLLANTSTGVSPGTTVPPGATVPNSEINTLANMLAACVNSSGGTYNDGSSCGTLFYNANPGTTSSTAPADTITAVLDIAQHPALSATKTMNLYNLPPPASPFQPTLSSQPSDFTIAVNFSGGNFSGPSALAADVSGNIWITNQTGNTVTELSHTGAVLSGTGYTGNMSAPSAIALAADGSVWVTNNGISTVTKLSSSGSLLNTYTGGGLSSPNSISFDALGMAWVANSNASVTTITNSGTLTNYTPAAATAPVGIAVNPH